MSLRRVDAVEVHCDGCGGRFDNGEYQFFLRDQYDDWIVDAGWREEDGKQYCCTNAPEFNAAVCWPPSMREGSDAA